MAKETFKDIFSDMTQEILYQRPESVGTIRVVEVFDEENRDFDMAILGFDGKWAEDNSCFMRQIPKAVGIKKDQIVEVVVRKSRIPFDETCLVAIRPFNKALMGSFYTEDEKKLYPQFSNNEKNPENSPRFFKKFFETRRRAEPRIP